MADDDYEIISHKEIEHLKHEIQDLKEGKSPESPSNIVAKLNQMLDLFKEASASMKEGKSTDSHKEILEKLDKLLDQNQKIAEGVLAVADLVSGESSEEQEPEPEQKPQQQSRPMMPGPAFPTNNMPMPPPRPGPSMPEPFPSKPEMPSLNPMEGLSRPSMNPIGGLPPLPPRPNKRSLFK